MVLLVSVADPNLFCLPGNVVAVVKVDLGAFFFTDTADDYTEVMTHKVHTSPSATCSAIMVTLFFNLITEWCP